MARGVRADKVKEFAAAREEALRLAWIGLQPTVIARKVGVSQGAVLNWLRAAGLPTAKEEAGTFPCPECGGRMEKQELFFWKCQCGAEWWPPEMVLPDPEDWDLPPRLAIEPEAYRLIKQLAGENLPYSEIAKIMNQHGYKTEQGKEWTKKRVADFIERHGLKFAAGWEEQHQKAVELIEYLANLGLFHREVAESLNTRGLKTRFGTSWTEDTVQAVFARRVKETEGRRINRMTKALLPERMKSKEHPWRLDDHARVAAIRRRYGRDALPNLPDKYDVSG